jgi:hypothetical protein
MTEANARWMYNSLHNRRSQGDLHMLRKRCRTPGEENRTADCAGNDGVGALLESARIGIRFRFRKPFTKARLWHQQSMSPAMPMKKHWSTKNADLQRTLDNLSFLGDEWRAQLNVR